jgi:peroxiredoxin
MKKNHMNIVKLGSIGLLMLLFLVVASQSSAKITEGMAPDFTLKSLAGENIKLSEHRGEVIMINFWASWSGPSREELPLLNALYKRYKNKGFTLFGVNVEDDLDKAKSLLREVQVSFPILLDEKNEVSKMYKVDSMPSTIILDRDGNMRYLHHGYVSGYEDEYQKQVRELMRE